MSSPITVDLDRASREQSYLQNGSTLVDRLRTRLVQREILMRLPKTSGLRVLDLGCGYHATYLKAIGDQLAEGVGVDFQVSEESRCHPRLSFVASSVEGALPALPSNSFDAVLFISVLEHVWDPAECLSHCHRVLKAGGRLLVNVPTWYANPCWNCRRSSFVPARRVKWTTTRCTTRSAISGPCWYAPVSSPAASASSIENYA